MVEMALVLPILLLLLLGIVEMGMIGFTYITAQNAVGAGANEAVIGGTDTQVEQAVIQASPGLDTSLFVRPIIIHDANDYSKVTITVNYPLNLSVSVIPGLSNPLNVVVTLTEEVP